ncbi:penicillin-binding protein, beta-lactamase class C [Leptolyngbya sp. PCC 7375]|nr:penicillin-binding protein, beta-lactamase class C [Leptolyngbya sp. PCC 7375]
MFGPGCQPSLQPLPTSAPFNQRLDTALAEIEAKNLNVIIAISHHGEPMQFKEFGAPAADTIPPEQTLVDINSITKTVTGVMAAKLVQQGKVSFDETLGDIFDNVPADKSNITVHQLLTHSAGFVESVGSDPEQLSKDDFLIRAFESSLEFIPGETYQYSNTGFGIVAAIIEARSGKSYEAYLREDVIAGLGLENTGYESIYDNSRSLKTRQDKTINQASWGNDQPYWNLIGNGGLVSTVEDMMRFRQAVVAGQVISPDMLAIVQTPHIREFEDDESFYGYGLVVEELDGIGQVHWHDGGNEVFSAQWIDYVEQGDLIFTAGTDEDAVKAIASLENHLYGGSENMALPELPWSTTRSSVTGERMPPVG